MRVAELRLENFRGVRVGRVRLGEHSVLVGPNNSGKTTIIEALALLFGRDRLVRDLTEHDFFGGDPQPADRLRLIATIVGFAGDDPGEHPDWFRDDRAVPKWFEPATGGVHAQRQDPTWQLACQIAFAARFDRPSLEVETARYFHDDEAVVDIFAEDVRTPVPGTLIREIGFFLVPASRTWDRIISFGSELFKRVIATGGGPPAQAVLVERDRVRAPVTPLEADPNLAPIVDTLNAELGGFFHPGPQLRLRLTSTDSDGVLDAVVPHYTSGGPTLPAKRQGSGLVSLQGLLLLLQFGRQRAAAGEGFWMALEEPELHVPPPLQRRLVQRLQALSTQTFVSTHSPMVAAMSDPRALTLLRNEGGVLSAVPFQPASLPAATPNAIRKLFQLHRLETISAMMSDAVLVPEGRTDGAWLDLLLRGLDARQSWGPQNECRFAVHVGIAPTQDAAVVATYETLRVLHPRVACLVDGDAEGLGYVNALTALAVPPAVVARWPDAWMLEDAIGWICDANAAAVISTLDGVVVPTPASIAELVCRLKSNDRNGHGLKHDHVAYEAISDAIAGEATTAARARELMNALSDTILGRVSARFVAVDGSNPSVRVFQP